MSSTEMDGEILDEVEELARSWIEKADEIAGTPILAGYESQLRACGKKLLKVIER